MKSGPSKRPTKGRGGGMKGVKRFDIRHLSSSRHSRAPTEGNGERLARGGKTMAAQSEESKKADLGQ